MKYRVANLTFDGLDSPLLYTGDVGGELGDMLSDFMNQRFPFGKFGWFYGVII